MSWEKTKELEIKWELDVEIFCDDDCYFEFHVVSDGKTKKFFCETESDAEWLRDLLNSNFGPPTNDQNEDRPK